MTIKGVAVLILIPEYPKALSVPSKKQNFEMTSLYVHFQPHLKYKFSYLRKSLKSLLFQW